ncbi:hypothetical protein ACXA18_03175 [Riemerella anatipestifer]|uniref:hypothetical protein n=1 Tax=Riemerella anatipestifer TaxID=34085 RepID=UPI001372C80D|nr:hypothetical protein [Riemerella anatipestifer]MBO4234057.1 hypothetical protein [Riemerella anatipestifer]NAV16662.1 hypothetical protein [Riemerella anatipestifer]
MSNSKILLSVARRGTGLFPTDAESEELIKSLSTDDNFNIALHADRNLKMHRAYFKILHFVWENLPEKFQKKCKKNHFYLFLKEMQGRYEISDISAKTSIKTYESLSFDKMSQKRFHEVFKEDVNFIITEILPALDMQDFVPVLITEFEKTLTKYNL